MNNMSRRSVIRGSLGLAAAGALARPYIANAAGQDRRRLAGPGLRPGGGRGVPQDGRGLREGQRQQDRPQHHAVHGAEPEGDLRADQRRRAGPDFPRRAGDDPAAERLERQAGGRERRRRDAQVQAQRDRAADLQLLQRRHQAAQLLSGAGQAGGAPFHIWGDLVEKAGFKLSDTPKTWDAFWDFFKPVQTGAARARACARCMPWACRSPPSDRTTATTCSRIS